MSTTTLPALPDLFRSLGDPTRLRLLRLLHGAEVSVGELAEALDMAQSGISRHLAVLKAAGLVSDRREGASTLYRVASEGGEARASALWPVVRGWLEDLPQAARDTQRLARIVAARSARSEAWFQQVAPHWDSLRAAQHGEEIRHLALLELVPRGLTVLDVGTGTGFMLLGAAPRAARLIGVDRSPAMLLKARENLVAAGVGGADLRLGEMEALPVEDESVDVVLSNMALHHASAPGKAVAEMARVLRPGGRVVVTDLAHHALEWTRDELADEWPGFEPEALASHLEAAGLDDVAVRAVGTCTLTRQGRERHGVDILLATAVKPAPGAPRRARGASSRTTDRPSRQRPARDSDVAGQGHRKERRS